MELSRQRPISDEECHRLWAAWTPDEVAQRLAGVRAPWCVVAGWALDFFTGGGARAHDDVEIAVPRDAFGEIAAALSDHEWDVVGDGHLWPREHVDDHHQAWFREPATGLYRLDVFREPHDADTWLCRRDQAIRLPYDELILHTRTGIPYVIPEVALLFKAKAVRAKDESDFARVLPQLDSARRERLAEWLLRVHPDHPWAERLTTGRI